MMSVNLSARMWGPYKGLFQTVDGAVTRKQPDAIQDLDSTLRTFKPDIISLLRNPPKNPTHREVIQKADKDGVEIQGQQGREILSKQFIEEALIISDLFDLNEFAAVELLMAGESQMAEFPGLTRGLIAVVLYYDGRNSLVSSLRLLLQACKGKTWKLDIPDEVALIATRFVDQVMNEDMISRILDLIKNQDITKEIEKLISERAIGNQKHRKQVTDLLKDIRLELAMCVFCWSSQCGLKRTETLKLIDHLRNHSEANADQTLDPVTQTLLMAQLYSIDIRLLALEDSEEAVSKLSMLSDEAYVPAVHKEVLSLQKWENPGLKAVFRMAWAVTLRTLAQYPENQVTYTEACEDDDTIMDMAIDEGVFQFLLESVISTPLFYREEFHLRQIHNVLTDFLVHFPLKVKELRNRGEEASRIIQAHLQEGLQPPVGIRRHFEQLLDLLGELYSKDPLNLELASEFWCPAESGLGLTTGSYLYSHQQYRPPQRQISLYKFVRLAGDLLPPSMYIPYLRLLTGLANGPQCAYQCFNLLKANGLAGAGHASTVSWDHFFNTFTQYYANLRQETAVVSDMSHVYRQYPRGITPQEVEGLVAALKLTRQIAGHDEQARMALCENPQWMTIVTFLGLVGCSIPIELKAEFLLNLAAFAKSPEIAATIWNSLESSQIIPTIPATGTHKAGGILVELDEVEAKNEEFPLTRGFVELLNILTDIPVPAGLGSGYRAPGFGPYMEFLRDSVFLKFNTRAYKDPAEKWQIAACTLEVFAKLLREYEASIEDFIEQTLEIQGGGTAAANKPPGFTLMVYLMNDSDMLKMVMYIIDEASRLLETYKEFPAKAHLEKAALCCLNMLECTLEKQEIFLAFLRDSGASLIVSPLDKLLLGINPWSGKADHVVKIAKFVIFNDCNPEHALSATRILYQVCQSAYIQSELVGMFTADEELGKALLHGFVECLEAPDVENMQLEEEIYEEDMSKSQIRCATRLSIMKLLICAIDQPSPNLAHFLLGFDINKPVAKTNLQNPMLGSPKTCLHSILSILDRGTTTGSRPTTIIESPHLAEYSYRLIYRLCANRETTAATRRYLRNNYDFLFRHTQYLPFVLDSKLSVQLENLLLRQQQWLLKAVAIELRLTTANKQRSHTQRLVTLLLQDSATKMEGLRTEGLDSELSFFDIDGIGQGRTLPTVTVNTGQKRRKILSILDSMSLKQSQLSPPGHFEFLDTACLQHEIEKCEYKSEIGISKCNVKLLHSILTSELNKVQGSATAGQRPHLMQEIETLLTFIVDRNEFREAVQTKKLLFESWRQVVEVILAACPDDLLQGEDKLNVIFEILQDLLIKVSDEEALPELTAPVARVILTLLANQRKCFLVENQDRMITPESSQYVTLLDAPGQAATESNTTFSRMGGSRTLFASSLQAVLKGLLEYIVKSSSGQQRVRAHLYGALLYYLQIAKKPKTLTALDSKQKLPSETEYDNLRKENFSTILGYGNVFMDIVSRDSCDGHDVGRLLALSTLETLLNNDHNQQWLSFLLSKGYVQHLVDSLLQDCQQLHNMYTQQCETFQLVFIYQSKMSLLTKMGSSLHGAQNLLMCGILQRLAQCSVLDMRPDSESHSGRNLMASYQMLLFPALKMCLTLLISLGSENQDVVSKVQQFIVAHIDVFNDILRDRAPSGNLASLEELSMTTAVLSKAALDVEADINLTDTAQIEARGHIARIRRLLMALLPRYSLTDKLLKKKKIIDTEHQSEVAQSQCVQLYESIAANILAFSRAYVSQSGTSLTSCRLLFTPSMAEATNWDSYSKDDLPSNIGGPNHQAGIGLLVLMLKQGVDQFLNVYELHKQYKGKLSMVTDLTTEELKEFCPVSNLDKISSQQKYAYAKKTLLTMLSSKVQELQKLSYMIENCLFLVWKHMDFYLQHCVPVDQETSLYQLNVTKQQMRRLQDTPDSSFMYRDDSVNLGESVSIRASRQDIERLKLDSSACLNDDLFKKLKNIEQWYSKERSRHSFVQALIRRIQGLIHLKT